MKSNPKVESEMKTKKKNPPERDYRKEMLAAEYYNYNRIPGYNHHTGWVENRPTVKRDVQIIEPYHVKFNIPE